MRIKELRGDEQKVQPNNLERPTQQMKENRGIKKDKNKTRIVYWFFDVNYFENFNIYILYI